MDARACMHSYCSALPPSQASSLLMLHVHVQKRPFSRPSIAENKNLALTCAPVSPHGAAGHKNQRRVLVWLFRSPPPPCQVSSRIGHGPCAASTCPFTATCCCQFRREVRRRFGNASTMCGHMCLVARPEPGAVGACLSPPARMQQ